MPNTTVINIKDAPKGWQDDPQYAYIGRAVPRKGIKASVYGNPYSVQKFGRDGAIAAFESCLGWALEGRTGPGFPGHRVRHITAESIRALKGKTLVCWCAPEFCHGDILAHLADEMEDVNA